MIMIMAGKRVIRLRVIGGSIELRDDVPASRADCPTERPCGHIRCKNHLWLIAGVDRRGRRGPNHALPESELVPITIMWPLPPSCAADLYGSEPDTSTIADALDMTRDAVAACARRAIKRLVNAVADRPEDAEVLRELIGATP